MKKCFAIILTAFILCSIPLTVYATEAEIKAASAFKCNVAFYITDETGGYTGSNFTANMTDNTGTITNSYKFTKANSWGGTNTPIYTMAAPATYTVTFDGLEEGYKIVSTLDHSETISFDTFSEGTANVLWSIVKDNNVTTENKGAESAILKQEENGNYTATNEGAEEVYKNFLRATAFIAEDVDWKNNLLQSYELFPHAERYASYVEGGTEEEYLSMSLYDRFVWSESYLKFAWAINSGNYNNYYGSEQNFASHITNDVVNMMKGAPNNEGVIESYLALADWQYNYVRENGVPFNFINNRSYLDEIKKVTETETKAETNKSDEEEMSEIAKELLKDADDKTREEVKEKGIWDDTLSMIANNIFTVLFILVLCIAVAVVVWRRKIRNIDDNHGGDTNVNSLDDN